MPKLWDETVATHRRAVRETVLETAASLVAEHGLRGATMSRIAERSGIGRATLYRYFADVESILEAWHERQVDGHLAQLEALRDRRGDPAARLAAVLEAYALAHHARADDARHAVAAVLHRDEHVARAGRRIGDFMRDLLADCARAGAVRADVAPHELAGYCLHTLTAAAELPSRAAVLRLVRLTLDGLRPPG